MIVMFLIYSITHWKDKFLRYLFWGNLCLFVFSLFSQINIMTNVLTKALPIFGSSLFYYEIGLFLELVFFLAGLNYKNRKRCITDQEKGKD